MSPICHMSCFTHLSHIIIFHSSHPMLMFAHLSQVMFPPFVTPHVCPFVTRYSFFEVYTGDAHSLAIGDGDARRLYAWGSARYGRLGIDLPSSEKAPEPFQPTPKSLAALDGYKVLCASAAAMHSVALVEPPRAAGARSGLSGGFLARLLGSNTPNEPGRPPLVFAWGLAAGGRLGMPLGEADVHHDAADGSSFARVPQAIRALQGTHVTSLSACAGQSFAVTASGECYAWGLCSHGRLGLGRLHGGETSRGSSGGNCGGGGALSSDGEHIALPTLIEGLRGYTIESVSAAEEHALALTREGQLLSWGVSTLGRLGVCASEVCFSRGDVHAAPPAPDGRGTPPHEAWPRQVWVRTSSEPAAASSSPARGSARGRRGLDPFDSAGASSPRPADALEALDEDVGADALRTLEPLKPGSLHPEEARLIRRLSEPSLEEVRVERLQILSSPADTPEMRTRRRMLIEEELSAAARTSLPGNWREEEAAAGSIMEMGGLSSEGLASGELPSGGLSSRRQLASAQEASRRQSAPRQQTPQPPSSTRSVTSLALETLDTPSEGTPHARAPTPESPATPPSRASAPGGGGGLDEHMAESRPPAGAVCGHFTPAGGLSKPAAWFKRVLTPGALRGGGRRTPASSRTSSRASSEQNALQDVHHEAQPNSQSDSEQKSLSSSHHGSARNGLSNSRRGTFTLGGTSSRFGTPGAGSLSLKEDPWPGVGVGWEGGGTPHPRTTSASSARADAFWIVRGGGDEARGEGKARTHLRSSLRAPSGAGSLRRVQASLNTLNPNLFAHLSHPIRFPHWSHPSISFALITPPPFTGVYGVGDCKDASRATFAQGYNPPPPSLPPRPLPPTPTAPPLPLKGLLRRSAPPPLTSVSGSPIRKPLATPRSGSSRY